MSDLLRDGTAKSTGGRFVAMGGEPVSGGYDEQTREAPRTTRAAVARVANGETCGT
jgi:hypothetical protein